MPFPRKVGKRTGMEVEMTLTDKGLICISVRGKGEKWRSITPNVGDAYEVVTDDKGFRLRQVSNESEEYLFLPRVTFKDA